MISYTGGELEESEGSPPQQEEELSMARKPSLEHTVLTLSSKDHRLLRNRASTVELNSYVINNNKNPHTGEKSAQNGSWIPEGESQQGTAEGKAEACPSH